MPQSLQVTDANPLIPFFGPHPLLSGEYASGYGQLLERVLPAVKPADIVEELWTHDFVTAAWEVLRLQRLRTGLILLGRQRAIEKVLGPICGIEMARDIARGCVQGDSPAVGNLEARLRDAGLGMECLMAEALAHRLGDVEKVEGLIAAAEARRDRLLREIELRRAELAERLRRKTEGVVEAEFEVVRPQPAASA